ncbi:Dolichyl-phosphate-mannose--protein mannosyltransferase 4 [Coemansia thaxteri]|uniref:Dolichyl-phosphate-mannose--protein mannosyltransferase n=1 Tax=Coemansia thaxteri TaxID=2663907 RepID=A0A9W8BIN6_9FUNG|nr:Dolichyl-phosphate-mannose--protein mannosyltransferase 4 [Coemansia thaxteri]KAJ2008013.1 Dolichyl-phosphate-mannose--protein mannosyltransferase 4 [Coemansia thaxteri]KAJ2469192.1 Dolichyl-phosphate-mannose--protein mannosyltransferase 4 [Coemansia sp. RSA 2322]KAJ2486173.1 Dolichyl-phosphate-mannose--protein mannosyltransferase 4 [Coemansia sp. RSA 2320]
MSVDEPQLKRRPGKDSAPDALPSAKQDTKPATVSATACALVRNSSGYAFMAVVALSFITRYWRIWDPAQVVFDEVHFGKFASFYLRREYYFDVHPPLAKMLIALGGWLVGYDGHFLFDKIGMDYLANAVPYMMLRGWVALFGFALPPLVYMIMAESGYSVIASLLAALLVTFDNALVTQGRLILLDNIMIFFMLASVYSYVKFYKQRYRPFGLQWWTWLLSTGTMLGCVVSCKLVGLFTIALVGAAVIFDLRRILDIRRGTTIAQFNQHFVARAFALIVVPVALYLSFFYIHFAVLTRTGTGDAYHTSQFQMQLIDNPMTKSSFNVHYGDQITLRHRDTGAFLDSNPARYPLRYEDQRVSSQGQQVTGVKTLGDNSYWMVKPTKDQEEFALFVARRQAGEDIPKEELSKWVVHHTDLVQLQHVTTNSNLRTHDVASPMTSTNMEITTLPLNDTANAADTVWKVDIEGAKANTTLLKTSSSFLRLVSHKHGVAMWTHAKKLPEWGHGHQEINGNKKPAEKSTLWLITEIRGRQASAEELEEMSKKQTSLSFLEKFVELQGLMIKHNNALTSVHPFQSTPLSWPLLTRGISFWTDAAQRKQIYLLGNPVGWWLANVALLFYAAGMVVLEICDLRNIDVVDGVVRRHVMRSGGFIAFAWLIHYFPFFLMGRSLFLHHYLPASIFAYMMVATCYQFICVHPYQLFALRSWSSRARALLPSYTAGLLFAAIVAVQVAVFAYFAPVSYGTRGLTPDEVNSRRWLSSYDMHFQK